MPLISLQGRRWTIDSISLDAGQQKWLLQARKIGPVENLSELQTKLDRLAGVHHGEKSPDESPLPKRANPESMYWPAYLETHR